MHILVVDPNDVICPRTAPALEAMGWQHEIARNRTQAFASALQTVPDVILIHGDGAAGEAAHLCQRFKHNPLTAGIPLVLVEDTAPPAWLLPGMPADAVAQSPWQPADLVHHIAVLLPASVDTSALDDLTNFPRRRSILNEMERRMVTRELFAAGLLTLREADAYRQDFGRTGLDQFVVLVSVLLRRHTSNGNPISIGYLDEGAYLILGAPTTVHEIVGQAIRDFESLVPAFYEMDALFGAQDQQVGPPTWIGLQGSVCLVEPGRFDNVLQVGFVLAESITAGNETVRPGITFDTPVEASAVAAD